MVYNRMIPKKIIYSGIATIVYWADGTKTVVKCSEGTPDDRYAAFCAALAKKTFGTNSKIKRLIREAEEYKGKVKEKKPPCFHNPDLEPKLTSNYPMNTSNLYEEFLSSAVNKMSAGLK